MTIKVDQNKCISCGLCVNTCPDTFAFNAQGKSEAISQNNPDGAKTAAAGCPAGAISVD